MRSTTRPAPSLVRAVLGLALSCAAACGHGGSPATRPTPPPAVGGPPASLCAELAPLIDAARDDFPAEPRARAVTVDNNPGFAASATVTGATGCAILTSEEPYPDALQCDLGPTTATADAKATVDRWAAALATCPQLATWHANEPSRLGQTWELELEDNHELAVAVFTEGDDAQARSVISVRKNEI